MFGKKEDKVSSETPIIKGKVKVFNLRHQIESSNSSISMHSYDISINRVIAELESKGYEIIDIKFNVQSAPRVKVMIDTIHTMIIYK